MQNQQPQHVYHQQPSGAPVMHSGYPPAYPGPQSPAMNPQSAIGQAPPSSIQHPGHPGMPLPPPGSDAASQYHQLQSTAHHAPNPYYLNLYPPPSYQQHAAPPHPPPPSQLNPDQLSHYYQSSDHHHSSSVTPQAPQGSLPPPPPSTAQAQKQQQHVYHQQNAPVVSQASSSLHTNTWGNASMNPLGHQSHHSNVPGANDHVNSYLPPYSQIPEHHGMSQRAPGSSSTSSPHPSASSYPMDNLYGGGASTADSYGYGGYDSLSFRSTNGHAQSAMPPNDISSFWRQNSSGQPSAPPNAAQQSSISKRTGSVGAQDQQAQSAYSQDPSSYYSSSSYTQNMTGFGQPPTHLTHPLQPSDVNQHRVGPPSSNQVQPPQPPPSASHQIPQTQERLTQLQPQSQQHPLLSNQTAISQQKNQYANSHQTHQQTQLMSQLPSYQSHSQMSRPPQSMLSQYSPISQLASMSREVSGGKPMLSPKKGHKTDTKDSSVTSKWPETSGMSSDASVTPLLSSGTYSQSSLYSQQSNDIPGQSEISDPYAIDSQTFEDYDDHPLGKTKKGRPKKNDNEPKKEKKPRAQRAPKNQANSTIKPKKGAKSVRPIDAPATVSSIPESSSSSLVNSYNYATNQIAEPYINDTTIPQYNINERSQISPKVALKPVLPIQSQLQSQPGLAHTPVQQTQPSQPQTQLKLQSQSSDSNLLLSQPSSDSLITKPSYIGSTDYQAFPDRYEPNSSGPVFTDMTCRPSSSNQSAISSESTTALEPLQTVKISEVKNIYDCDEISPRSESVPKPQIKSQSPSISPMLVKMSASNEQSGPCAVAIFSDASDKPSKPPTDHSIQSSSPNFQTMMDDQGVTLVQPLLTQSSSFEDRPILHNLPESSQPTVLLSLDIKIVDQDKSTQIESKSEAVTKDSVKKPKKKKPKVIQEGEEPVKKEKKPRPKSSKKPSDTPAPKKKKRKPPTPIDQSSQPDDMLQTTNTNMSMNSNDTTLDQLAKSADDSLASSEKQDHSISDLDKTIEGETSKKPRPPRVRDGSRKKKLPKFALKFSKTKKRKRVGSSDNEHSDLEKTPPPSPDEVESGVQKRRSARNTKKLKYNEDVDELGLSDSDSENQMLIKATTQSLQDSTDIPLEKTALEEQTKVTKDEPTMFAAPVEDTMMVEKILAHRMGKRELEPDEGEVLPEDGTHIDVEEFYVKFKNLSYLHCDWRTEEELEKGDRRISQKIKRYRQKKNSSNIFSFMDEEPFDLQYCEVDRILAINEVEELIRPEEKGVENGANLEKKESIQELEPKLESESESKPIIKQKPESESKPESELELESESKPKFESKLESEHKCKSGIKPESEHKPESDSESEQELEPKSVSESKSIFKPETEVDDKPVSESKPEAIGTNFNDEKSVAKLEGISLLKSGTDENDNEKPPVKETFKDDTSAIDLPPDSNICDTEVDYKQSDIETKSLMKQEIDPIKASSNQVVKVDDNSCQDSCEEQKKIKKKVSRHFLVKWRGLSYEDSTWEHEEDLDPEKIKHFMRFKDPPPKSKWKSVKRPKPDEWVRKEGSPVYKNGNTLREYQLEGINWLSFCWHQGRNCILADEMGLGKTIQSIAFVNEIYQKGIYGPFLIIVPLSTVGNWAREFETWTDLNVITYHGSSASREMLKEYEMYYRNEQGNRITSYYKFQVMITTFEIILSDCLDLRDIHWRCCIIDEAHRLKNRNCKLLEGLRLLNMEHRVLLTGTPLQNNVEELFSLLNFLEPTQFASTDQFLLEFGDLKTEAQVDKLKLILKPMMLRRLKEDVEKTLAPKEETIVEVELTNIQKKYYRAILEKNFSFLSKGGGTSNNIPNLMNTMMELRKCCIHPYLINGAEEQILFEAKEAKKNGGERLNSFQAMVNASGKLVLIDKLLPRLKADGHRVLIFSQMVRCLDILEDYITHKHYPFERIDGRVRGNERQQAIDRFSRPGSDRFVFLLCTRAGGLGINLTAADTVIIFDSDWNPQNDLQAQARCHRIGQSKAVKIYRLICRNTYEREMFDKASLKLGLDKAVLQSMNTQKGGPGGLDGQLTKKEIEELLRKGAYGALMDDDNAGDKFCEEDIDHILSRRTQVITIDNSEAKGSTFSKATFSSSNNREDIELDDPNFWEKWAKKANLDADELLNKDELIVHEPRRRTQTKRFGADGNIIEMSDFESSDEDEETISMRTRGSRGRSAKTTPLSCGKRKRGRFDLDDEFFGERTGQWTKGECFQIEKGLLAFGWGRWKEIIDNGHFKRQITEEDCENLARVILLYCLNAYKGDDKIRTFTWELITPEIASNKLGDGDPNVSTRGKKSKSILVPSKKSLIEEMMDAKWLKETKYNPQDILTDDQYKKHLQRNSYRLLMRVKNLHYIKYDMIKKNQEKIDNNYPASEIELDSFIVEGDPPATWWDDEADKSLIIGTYKHGHDKFNAIRSDPSLIFLSKCGLPNNLELNTETEYNEYSSKTMDDEESESVPTHFKDPDATAILEKLLDSVSEKNEYLSFPSANDLNMRLKRILTSHQKNSKRIELQLAQKVKDELKKERTSRSEAMKNEREEKRRSQAQKWSRREVEKGLMIFGWGRWKEILATGNFKHEVSIEDCENLARAILLYSINSYKGDDKLRSFIWELITPDIPSLKTSENDGNVSNRGRKSKSILMQPKKSLAEELTDAKWLKDSKYNPQDILTDDQYKKHLQRNSYRLLVRIKNLHYLKNDIIKSNQDKILDNSPLTEIDLGSFNVEGDSPTTWWDEEADKSLILGVFKHGHDKFNDIRADPALIFFSKCGPPNKFDINCETEFNESQNKSMYDDESESVPTQYRDPDATAVLEKLLDSVSGTNEYLTFPSANDLNLRLKRILTSHQKVSKKLELQLAQKAKDDLKKERITRSDVSKLERDEKKKPELPKPEEDKGPLPVGWSHLNDLINQENLATASKSASPSQRGPPPAHQKTTKGHEVGGKELRKSANAAEQPQPSLNLRSMRGKSSNLPPLLPPSDLPDVRHVSSRKVTHESYVPPSKESSNSTQRGPPPAHQRTSGAGHVSRESRRNANVESQQPLLNLRSIKGKSPLPKVQDPRPVNTRKRGRESITRDDPSSMPPVSSADVLDLSVLQRFASSSKRRDTGSEKSKHLYQEAKEESTRSTRASKRIGSKIDALALNLRAKRSNVENGSGLPPFGNISSSSRNLGATSTLPFNLPTNTSLPSKAQPSTSSILSKVLGAPMVPPTNLQAPPSVPSSIASTSSVSSNAMLDMAMSLMKQFGNLPGLQQFGRLPQTPLPTSVPATAAPMTTPATTIPTSSHSSSGTKKSTRINKPPSFPSTSNIINNAAAPSSTSSMVANSGAPSLATNSANTSSTSQANNLTNNINLALANSLMNLAQPAANLYPYNLLANPFSFGNFANMNLFQNPYLPTFPPTTNETSNRATNPNNGSTSSSNRHSSSSSKDKKTRRT